LDKDKLKGLKYKVVYNDYKVYENGNIYKNNILIKIHNYSNSCIRNKRINKAKFIYEIFVDKLKDDEKVVHIDFDKTNFHYKNLKVIKKTEYYYNKELLDKNKKWKYIKGYNKKYLISDHGDVFSCIYNCMIKASKTKLEYYQMKLQKNKKQINKYIHVLVYETFIGKKNENFVIDHINRNKLDNKLTNLREVSKSDNAKNCVKKLNTNKIILQYSLNNKLIKIWYKLEDIIKTNNYSNKKIMDCLCNKKENAYNYIWKYEKKLNQKTVDKYFKPVKTNGDIDFSHYKINKNGDIINNKNIIIIPSTNKNYKCINLSVNKQIKSFKIHRLVALTFLDKQKNKNIVNHLDNNSLNNHVSNLEWTTNKGNSEHGIGIKINKHDLKTNKIIETYPTLKKAYKSVNKLQSYLIGHVCQGKKDSIYGFKWSYA